MRHPAKPVDGMTGLSVVGQTAKPINGITAWPTHGMTAQRSAAQHRARGPQHHPKHAATREALGPYSHWPSWCACGTARCGLGCWWAGSCPRPPARHCPGAACCVGWQRRPKRPAPHRHPRLTPQSSTAPAAARLRPAHWPLSRQMRARSRPRWGGHYCCRTAGARLGQGGRPPPRGQRPRPLQRAG